MTYITSVELHKNRGWSESLISNWLGVPDLIAYPNERTTPFVRLFDLDRVEKAEANADLSAKLKNIMDKRLQQAPTLALAAKKIGGGA